MIHSVASAISELSAGMTLQKGTIIATGTPSGVGLGMNPPKFLKKGDTVRCDIEKIGHIKNTVG
jgi:2-keto-4-pentenoate hydratase/2-oxohepta-3-ene-1,7-dioic acid hydratase in catechol pathway